MRLLTLDEKGELSLIERSGDSIPEYAILSHTWRQNDEEVTYNDLIEGASKDKPGYSKVEFCVEQAARDGLQYSWVDTCCIDRWNLHELSNAINSMFRWYRNATKCYVLLSDVPELNTIEDKRSWEAAFRKSRWFTRGWTLQELIAPASVEFFSSAHQRLGDKQLLEHEIYEITGIPVEALRGRSLANFSVEERMAWTKNRQTTEEEDGAYCLLGIFGVQMPLYYGEGKENALNRLRREVESTESTPFIVPFDRNSQFTGRESQLAELEETLFVEARSTKAAITRMGGIGKTQLVLELAYRTREKYKNCSVLWIPATSMESLHQAYTHIAQRLSISGWDNEKADVKRLVQLHLSKENAGQWLLIFDNADDVSLWTAGPGSRAGAVGLIEYLPSSEQGCTVFTTRHRETAVKLGSQNIVEVPEMDQDIAQRMLQNCLTNRSLTNERREANLLLEMLTYLPLAIVLAAAYINTNNIAIKEYLSLLEKQEDETIRLLSEKIEDESRPHGGKHPLATTWLISFEQIHSCNTLAADFMSFMACIDQRDIPLSLLLTGQSRREEIGAVEILTAYSMIIKRPAGSALDIHQLVHLATRNWLRKEGQLVKWAERAIGRLEEVFPDGDHWNRSKWRRLLPHANYTLKLGLIWEGNKARANLVRKCATSLYNDGRYDEAEVYLLEAVQSEKKELGEEHPDTLTSIGNLASTYKNQGRWKEAEELFVQVIETKKRVPGMEHASTLTSMNNLASTYRNQGQWKEAEELFIQVMKRSLRALGPEHSCTLTSIGNLASMYRQRGRWKAAEQLDLQVMETFKKVLGAEHPDTLISMANLASTYWHQGRWKEAEELFVQVIETRKRVLGAEHPSTIASMANLASTYRNQGQWNEAEELDVQVMETSLRVMGVGHPSTLSSMANLASTYRNQGRWKEAEELCIQVMEARKKMLGAEHPDTLTSISNLSLTYKDQGRWKEAEELDVQVMETFKRVLGAEHPEALSSMANLASTYRNQGRWKEAKELQAQELKISSRVLGENHPDTLISMENLALIWKAVGRNFEAVQLLQKCVELQTQILGGNHPYTLSSSAMLIEWQAENLNM